MFDAEFYTKNCDLQRSTTRNFLQRSGGLLTISPDDVIMDIGCGPGDVTTQILVPALSNRFKKLYGVDHSSGMINHAKSHNLCDERIEYRVVDIGAENAVKHNMKGTINHIYSFYCFHWVKNQKQLFLNLYDLLVPGGDMLCKFGAKSIITHAWAMFKRSDKWGRYLRDAEIPYFGQELPKTISNLMQNLDNAGFSHLVTIREKHFTYDTDADYRAAMQAVCPWLENIPLNLQREIMDEFMIETIKYNLQVMKLNRNIASRTFSHTCVEMLARKRL